jgi:hypothetical protein
MPEPKQTDCAGTSGMNQVSGIRNQESGVLLRLRRVLDMSCRAAAHNNLTPDSCFLIPVPGGKR